MDGRELTFGMNSKSKLRSLDDLAAVVAEKRAEGFSVVHAHGVFDLLHVGHIRHLRQARSMGQVLVVTLTPDHFVNKGPHRPAFHQDLRAEALASLEFVDFVAVNRWPTAVETIRLLKPSIFVKGGEFKQTETDITGAVGVEAAVVREVGGEIRFTEEIVFSSSNLLNRHFSPFSAEVEAFLEAFRKRRSTDEVLEWIEKMGQLRPLVVGEAIINEYLFCQGIGKSTKDPVLAVQQEGLECCAGGSLAIANHLAGFCEEVRLVTQLGEIESREEFVRASLQPRVNPTLLVKSGAPTIRKQRIVDRYSGNKLLEIYRMEDRITSGDDARQLETTLKKKFHDNGFELAIVADYGHGMLNEETIKLVCNQAPWLALNVQCNAGNRGLNHVSKYPSADYTCVAGHELDIEIRQRELTINERVKLLSRRIQCPRFTITTGKRGTLHYDCATGFHETPAFAAKVVDRVGAGDGVLAVTSLLVKLGAPWDIVGLIGNAAGGMCVAELGNRTPLAKVPLSRYIVSLLK